MGKIQILFGIYDISLLEPFHFEGFNHKETRETMVMSLKLKDYLLNKAIKFRDKYPYKWFAFTLGRDADNHIETIAVCHPYHDKFDPEVAEDIVIGRIKRMRGDIKEHKYVYNKDGEIIDEIDVYYKPYDLSKHRYTKMRNGDYHDDGFKYPYVYIMTKEGK